MMMPVMPLTDPDGSGSLVRAATWVRALVTGTPATILATVAVAVVGLMLLSGRIPLRRAASVLLGCFVIFGAGTIASGLLEIAASGAGTPVPATTEPVPPTPNAVPAQPTVPDPYAGASVPVQ